LIQDGGQINQIGNSEMNERIDCLFNEIVNLRLKEAQGTHLVPSTIDMYKRRLVAIVVEECCNWIDGTLTSDEGMILLTKSFIIANIKGHFGVKE
jgi:ribosomal protein L29